MSEIKMEIEKKTQDICGMYECLVRKLKCELEKGIECVDTDEAFKVADIIKDLACAKKDIVKAMYYASVTEAMDAYDGVEDERFYSTPVRRDARGRFMRNYTMPMEMYRDYDAKELRDMDRQSRHAMYYTDTNGMNRSGNSNGNSGMNGGMRGYEDSQTRYDSAKRHYTETKAMHKSDSSEDNSANMNAIGKIMNALTDDMKEMMHDMTPSEKTFLKQKLNNMAQEIK